MSRGAMAAAAVLSAVLAGCAAPETERPQAPAPAVAPRWSAVAVTAEPVELGTALPAGLRYAGGIALSSADTSRLHGLSDLRMSADGRLVAVSDDGDLFEARLVLDEAGKLTGLAEGRIKPLTGRDGGPLQGKAHADAEGLAVLADGARLVSFERDHRIWRYPADGAAPTAAPKPDADLPENEGFEALAVWSAKGADAYLAGAEGGKTWLCRLAAGCAAVDLGVRAPAGFGLVAADLSGPEPVLLWRAWDPLRGSRIRVTVGNRELLALQKPAAVDNFEGLSVVGRRIYLLSDDNFSPTQRTLLLAFDLQD